MFKKTAPLLTFIYLFFAPLSTQAEVSGKNLTFDGVAATHVIAKGNTKKSATVLMLHGFASSKDEVGSLYKKLASSLASQGINSLRIDFRGFGDTKMPMEKMTVDTMIVDAKNAAKYLETLGVTKISVQGFSLGSEIALISFSDNPLIKNLSLWSTPYSLMGQYNEIEKKDRDIAYKSGKVNIDLGWTKIDLSKEFFESLKVYKPIDDFEKFQGDTLLISGQTDSLAGVPQAFAKQYPLKKITTITIASADHIYNVLDETTKEVTLIEFTTAWFKEHI